MPRITKKMLEKINFKKYLEEGIKMSKEKPMDQPKVKTFWVRKMVSSTDWKRYYSQISAYCYLRKEKEGVAVGFCVANEIPRDCESCTDDEILQIDAYRRTYNIYPRPCEEIINNQQKVGGENNQLKI